MVVGLDGLSWVMYSYGGSIYGRCHRWSSAMWTMWYWNWRRIWHSLRELTTRMIWDHRSQILIELKMVKEILIKVVLIIRLILVCIYWLFIFLFYLIAWIILRTLADRWVLHYLTLEYTRWVVAIAGFSYWGLKIRWGCRILQMYLWVGRRSTARPGVLPELLLWSLSCILKLFKWPLCLIIKRNLSLKLTPIDKVVFLHHILQIDLLPRERLIRYHNTINRASSYNDRCQMLIRLV